MKEDLLRLSLLLSCVQCAMLKTVSESLETPKKPSTNEGGQVFEVEHLGLYPSPYLKLSPMSPQIKARGDVAEAQDQEDVSVGNSQALQVATGNNKRKMAEDGKRHHRRRRKNHKRTRSRVLPLPITPGGNPLKDQPNLSEGRKKSKQAKWTLDDDITDDVNDGIIDGSQQAFTLTKADYLKREMCKTQSFKQVIHVPGCEPVTVSNKFCYGQCNSFFIPRWTNNNSNKQQEGGSGQELSDAFSSVAHCRPHRGKWVKVRLYCENQRPKRPWKRIYVVKDCKCMAMQELPLA